MLRWRNQLLAVVRKEIRQTLQDRRVLFLLVVAPFLQLLVFGFAIDLGVDAVPTVVVDQDRSPEGRALVAGLLADGTLVEVGEAASVAEAEAALARGEAAAAVFLPSGLARDLDRGDPATVQVVLDGSDPTRSGVAGGAAVRFFGARGLALARDRLEARLGAGRGLPSVEVRPRLLYNPTLSSPVYMVPGIAGMLLLIVTTVVTSMGLARERELGTLEAVRVTPIPTPLLMLGKVLPFVAVGLFDVTLAITAGAWIFEVPLRGSLWLFYGLTLLYLLTTVGMGLLISTIAQNQQQAFLGGLMFLLPAMLLSGTLTPIHAMPSWLQPVTLLNPLRYYMEGIRAVLLKGATTGDVAHAALGLAVLGSAILGTAVRRFRKRVA
ncbi:MAG: ABC transporter permease [Alphaproteobacteria bacterium]|nr:ABC transporter permease [Alphaproteobacteria bacterium]